MKPASTEKLAALARNKLVWLALIVAPLVVSAIAYAQFPAGVSEIPVHWNARGQVDEYGSPDFVFLIGAIMAATNGVLVLCCAKSDKLYDKGLVHGVSRQTTPLWLLGVAVIIVLIHIGVMAFAVNKILQAI